MNRKRPRTIISPDDHRKPLVMIADAHVSRRQGNVEAFFDMLAALEGGSGDVVFLGDIFDLWIALPRYENDWHRAFLSWCRQQKTHRRIGFIEGNHEYFLAQEHVSDFTWCSQSAWWMDTEGNLFCHGDRINRQDRNYLAFRKLVKNPITKTVIRLIPNGPQLVRHIKRGMKQTSQAFRKTLPLTQLQTFAENRFAAGATKVFLGHFHHPYHYEGRHGGELNALPGWCSQGWVGVLPSDRRTLQQGPWQDILPTI